MFLLGRTFGFGCFFVALLYKVSRSGAARCGIA